MLTQLKAWAKKLKREVFVLYLAYKDKRTPWFAKLFAASDDSGFSLSNALRLKYVKKAFNTKNAH